MEIDADVIVSIFSDKLSIIHMEKQHEHDYL